MFYSPTIAAINLSFKEFHFWYAKILQFYEPKEWLQFDLQGCKSMGLETLRVDNLDVCMQDKIDNM